MSRKGMTTKFFIIAHLLFLWTFVNLNCVLAINRDYKQNESQTNHSYYDTDREMRQYGGYGGGLGSLGGLGGLGGYGGGGLSTLGGPIEAIIIGLLVVFGIGIIGIPFFLLFMNLFNGGGLTGGGLGGIGGLNLVPTTTTTVAGRKRREALPEVNPVLQQKLFKIFENFVETPHKIKLIKKILESVTAHK